MDPSKYPKARRDGTKDVLHGLTIPDEYRWLEDPDSEETKSFVISQNELTQTALEQCDTRQNFKELFTKLYDYPKFSTPFKRGDRYYYYHNSGLQQQYVIYSQASITGEATVFLDPNTLSADGTVALSGLEFSEDGKYVCYNLSKGGSDWSEIKVMSVGPNGEAVPMEDHLKLVKFSSSAWTHDHKGFFYNRFPSPEGADTELGTETGSATDQQLCYHLLGTPQSSDTLVYAVPEHPTWMVGAGVTEDGRYLTIYISDGCSPVNRLYYVDMDLLKKTAAGTVDFEAYKFASGKSPLPLVKLIDNFDASFSVLANEGSKFSFITNLNAPRYRIVQADLGSGSAGPPSSWAELVPQHAKDVLKSATALKGDALVLRYLRDVRGVLQLRSLSSGALEKELSLPGVGAVGGFQGDRKSSECFFTFSSFTEPGAQYRMDLSSPEGSEPQLFRSTELKIAHDPADYVTHQVFVTSKDGTRVPMFVTHRKGRVMDGSAPTLLYGYGGFNISLEPGFSASRLTFIKGYNGIYVQANIRGGGEYGIAWRDAGSKENKQNVFDDFQACAEYLIANKYTSAPKLTIQGGSNGGLLVAACANQRPDLYACVLGQVGVMDMLRFHKFTVGHAWTTDYGSADNEKDFKYMLPYSPLHNVTIPSGGSRQYPAVLLMTGDHDDRVVPLHTLKLIAELQHQLVTKPLADATEAAAAAAAARAPASSAAAEVNVSDVDASVSGVDVSASVAQRNPLLVRVELKAGHGAGKPTAKIIEETADMFGFAAKCMDAKWVL
ncbi:MAG: hypothetical protein WDW36_000797 [Sanguina aurantia]